MRPQGLAGGGSLRSLSGTMKVLGLKIRASLFRSSRKKPICTPKMINDVDKAVKNATMLMPASVCAVPLPELLVVVADAVADVVPVALTAVVLDIVAI